MLEFYVARHKRWKNKAWTKKRRRQLNTVIDSETDWGSRYIRNISSGRRRNVVPTSRYHRYLDSRLGQDVGEVYSELSRLKMYRGNGRHEIKEWFTNDIQREREYRRGIDNRLELVPAPKESPLPELQGYVTTSNGWLLAWAYVWYPYKYAGKVMVTGLDEQNTPYLFSKGWWGLYIEKYQEYTYEVVTDTRGRPLFTKEEYKIRVTDSYYRASTSYRTIPAGGPLLRESVRMVTRYDWKMVPDWEIRLSKLKER